MEWRYTLSDGELLITDTTTDTIAWRGKPDGYPVSKVLPLPDSDDCIVLLEYSEGPRHAFENLLRLCADGSIRWRAGLPEPESNDAYVDVAWTSEGLVAHSWSSYKVAIDVRTGQILRRTFTK